MQQLRGGHQVLSSPTPTGYWVPRYSVYLCPSGTVHLWHCATLYPAPLMPLPYRHTSAHLVQIHRYVLGLWGSGPRLDLGCKFIPPQVGVGRPPKRAALPHQHSEAPHVTLLHSTTRGINAITIFYSTALFLIVLLIIALLLLILPPVRVDCPA